MSEAFTKEQLRELAPNLYAREEMRELLNDATVDYKELLRKYIEFVVENEGVSFIGSEGASRHWPADFTEAEQAELQRFEDEAE